MLAEKFGKSTPRGEIGNCLLTARFVLPLQKNTNETGSYTMKLTAGTAAKQANCSKPTISRALNSGDLSGEKMPDGSYRIDPAELMRWNAERSRRGGALRTVTPSEPSSNGEPGTLPLVVELAELRVKLAGIELERTRERETLSETIGDLRRRLDESEKERRADKQAFLLLAAPETGSRSTETPAAQKLLAPPAPPPEPETPALAENRPAERVGLFARVLAAFKA